VAGKVPVKRNRFVALSGGDRAVNRDLEAKARALAGIKGYVTNLPNPTAGTVISAYHQLATSWRPANAAWSRSMSTLPSALNSAGRLLSSFSISEISPPNHLPGMAGLGRPSFLRDQDRKPVLEYRCHHGDPDDQPENSSSTRPKNLGGIP
jgi:hypothetical protein